VHCMLKHYIGIFHSNVAPRALHSFPTRRSSDLARRATPARRPEVQDAGRPLEEPQGAERGARPSAREEDEHGVDRGPQQGRRAVDRKSTRLNSSHLVNSYAVFCLKKKNKVYETG